MLSKKFQNLLSRENLFFRITRIPETKPIFEMTILDRMATLVNYAIKDVLTSFVDQKTKKLITYQIETGGKRLRPILAMISCKMLGGKIKDVLYPAAGLEILHNYTLIIDDIIDHSTLRRNQPTTWAKFGKSIAECIGASYSSSIFQAVNRSPYARILVELFAKTLKQIVDGEILDILFEQQGREEEDFVRKNRYRKIDRKAYLKMVSKKTASLFKASCQTGAICAKATPEEIKLLGEFGFNLGIAFQIQDDTLDIFGEKKVFGKEIGKDIKERKLGNIIVLEALKELSQNSQKKLLSILRKKEISSLDIKEAVNLIQQTKALDKAKDLAKRFIKKAKENLKPFPQTQWKKLLLKIADFVIERQK